MNEMEILEMIVEKAIIENTKSLNRFCNRYDADPNREIYKRQIDSIRSKIDKLNKIQKIIYSE